MQRLATLQALTGIRTLSDSDTFRSVFLPLPKSTGAFGHYPIRTLSVSDTFHSVLLTLARVTGAFGHFPFSVLPLPKGTGAFGHFPVQWRISIRGGG